MTAPVLERNVFRFGSTPGDGRPVPVTLPASGGTEPKRAGSTTANTAASASKPPDDVTIRLAGIVRARGRVGPVAVLTDADGVYHGIVSGIVKGRYRILVVTTESVEIEDLARGTRLALPLSGT